MDEKENKTNPDLDLDQEQVTTAASPRPSVWKMPEPVFRKTSGRLPQGFEKELASARAKAAASDQAQHTTPDQAQADPVTATTPDNRNPEPAADRSAVKLILVLLGIAGMIAFIAVFLTVVYFFFLRSSSP